jgi:hypothetical protein
VFCLLRSSSHLLAIWGACPLSGPVSRPPTVHPASVRNALHSTCALRALGTMRITLPEHFLHFVASQPVDACAQKANEKALILSACDVALSSLPSRACFARQSRSSNHFTRRLSGSGKKSR